MSLEMALFYYFIWLSNIPLYIHMCVCITSSLSIHLLIDINVASISSCLHCLDICSDGTKGMVGKTDDKWYKAELLVIVFITIMHMQ